MKIGIDASRAFVSQRTGIEEYSYQVINNLVDKLEGHQVVLYVTKAQSAKLKVLASSSTSRSGQSYSEKLKADNFIIPNNWKIRVIKMPRFWTQIGLSLEMLFHPIDVLFVPAHVVPIIHPKNTIVTVHGLEFEVFPEGYSFWARMYMRWSIKMSCRWAKKIIAVSNNTKKDLIEIYNVPEEKIEVVYEGVNLVQSSKCKVKSYSLKLKVEKPYLLYVGRLEKRKNVEGIVEAYKILKEKYNIPHKLVLAGSHGYGYEHLKLKIKNLFQISNFKFQIIELGFVTEEEKWQLLSNADIFLFPTFYEGFGLPILEAQSMGTPVVTSSIHPYMEVAGDAAVFCDPKSPASIAGAIYKIISSEELKNDLIKKGHENVKRFSWEKCAVKIAVIFEKKSI